MLPYRTAKPHAGTDAKCSLCAPTGPGHMQCQNCDQFATTQTRRHATDAEYAAIPATLAPVDGIMHQAVYGCDDCADGGGFDAICSPQTHQVEPVPCPKCHAAIGQPCVKKDGTARMGEHIERVMAQPAPETCTHAHRADCQIFTGCQCAENDTPPIRPKRATGVVHWPDMTEMRIPIPAAQMLVAQNNIAWHQVAAIRSKVTQIGGKPAIDVDVYQTGPTGDRIFDGHGKAITETVEIQLPAAPPGGVA